MQSSANQFEMLSNQNKEDIKTETDCEEPTGPSTSEASERDHSMPIQEAIGKPLANEAKGNFLLPTCKQDVNPTKMHLTQVLSSTTSQLIADDNLSSTVPPGNKPVQEDEAIEVQSQKEIPTEGESFDNQGQGLENQSGLLNCSLASEDVRLPSIAAENICSPSLPPSCCITNHVETKNPIRKQGNFSYIFPPDSEMNKRQQGDEPVDTTSQSKFEEIDSQLQTREDGKVSGQEAPSLEKVMPQNQNGSQKELPQTEPRGRAESPSPSIPALLLQWHRGERIQIRQAAESMLKALLQEFKYNMESFETRDPGAEAAAPFPSVFPLHYRLACNYLLQVLVNAISSEADLEGGISLDFLPWSEGNPGREKNKNVNQPPVTKMVGGLMNATIPQEELFSNHIDPNRNPENLPCNSGAEGAARTPFTEATEMDSRSNLNQGNSEVSFPNQGISSWISQANARPMDNPVTCDFNTYVPKLTSSSYCLPWNKYLQGREKRRAFIHSFYNLGKNVTENPWVLKTRGCDQHTSERNPPIASRLTGQSRRGLFRSNSS